MNRLLLFAIAALFISARLQEKEDTNAKIKVVYIYNFCKYIDWPSDYKEGSFTISVLGGSGESDGSVFSELNKMAEAKKQVGNQKFEINQVSSVSKLQRSHIVFVPASQSAQLADVINKVKSNSTLVVTEKAGLAKQGAIINFIVKDNRQKFELNESSAKKHNLKVSSNLVELAILVE